MKQPEQLLELLEYGVQLKQLPRTGWLQRGILNGETIASHSYGVSLLAMALMELIDAPFDNYRVMQLTTIHDLPEALTSDIPSPVKRFFPAELRATLKHDIERNAMHEITRNLPFGVDWNALWEEMAAGETAEAKLCRDADKLDMYIQVYSYEEQTGNKRLAEFWTKRHVFNYPETQAVYDLIVERRTMTQ